MTSSNFSHNFEVWHWGVSRTLGGGGGWGREGGGGGVNGIKHHGACSTCIAALILQAARMLPWREPTEFTKHACLQEGT